MAFHHQLLLSRPDVQLAEKPSASAPAGGTGSEFPSSGLHFRFITPALFAPAPGSQKHFHANCEFGEKASGTLSSRHASLIRHG